MSSEAIAPITLLPDGSVFEPGAVRYLADLCTGMGLQHPLVVTDRGLARSGMIAGIVADARWSGLVPAVFADVDGNPTAEQVQAGVDTLREDGHDGVIAIGGGSALDAGKAIAFAARLQRPLFDFAFDRHRGEPPEAEAPLPWIAVPTTAGTGSEVSPSAVITDAGGAKRSVMHPAMYAPRVLCDPGLTFGLPPELTAWTGIDALTHCLEALCAPGDDAEADSWALDGLRRIRHALPRAFEHPYDTGARSDMLAAALLGARAFRKGLGGLHAVSHALAARFGGQHGCINAVLLPHVIAANRPAIDATLGRAATAMELEPVSAEALVDWLAGLYADLNVPAALPEIGIDWGGRDLPALCAAAEAEPNAATNPVPVDSAWARRVLEAARSPSA